MDISSSLSNGDTQLMTMKLQAVSGSRVNFQDFPTEIILIIFVYTLPDDALDQKQPNTKIAPMLLCHVCSEWRSIALQFPRLWMCLYHVVRITVPCVKQELGLLKWGIHPAALEFLIWWRRNLGSKHLFHFHCDATFEGSYARAHPGLEDVLAAQEHILVTLFNLAQHLYINDSVAQMIPDVRPTLTLSNLETLRIRNEPQVSQWEVSPVPAEAVADHTIRKLHIQRYGLWDVFKKPIISWSSLTHLVFTDVYLTSGVWFDLIRACVNLQFGYFDLYVHGSDDPRFVNAPHFTHHNLRQLVIGWGDCHRKIGRYMLRNVLLPSLTAFRISAQLATKDLHCILESMPSLLELHLGYQVAANNVWHSTLDYDCFPEPLSKYAPNVERLAIETRLHPSIEHPIKEIIENLFSSSWLQLQEPTNSVRSLVIQAPWQVAGDLRREIGDWLAQNAICGVKVDVVADNEPLLWASSPSLERNPAEYFDEPYFCKYPPNGMAVNPSESNSKYY